MLPRTSAMMGPLRLATLVPPVKGGASCSTRASLAMAMWGVGYSTSRISAEPGASPLMRAQRSSGLLLKSMSSGLRLMLSAEYAAGPNR